MFSIEKTAQAAACLLRKHDGRLNCDKLVKLMYLADRALFNAIGHSMTGDEFYAYPNGSALGSLSALIRTEGMDKAQGYWDALFKTEGDELAALKSDIPFGRLSPFEMRALDELDAKFHNATHDDLIEYIHATCKEWSDPSPDERKPITSADILAALGCSKREVELIEAENAAYELEEAIIEIARRHNGQRAIVLRR